MSALRRRLASILLAVGFAGAGAVAAPDRIHTVAAGESAASVAKRYYGEASVGELLLRFNGKTGKVLHPGDKLTIPYCAVYQARPGDTWSALAKRRLGRAGAAWVLAELNGSAAADPLRAGARVVFPVVLRHALARGETLASLAERYYGDPKKATTLQAFSRLGDAKRLPVGTPLEIPIVAFVRREPEPVQEVPVAPPAAADNRRFEDALAAAGRAFAEGEYDRARELLESMRERVAGEGGVADRREWGRLMAFAYVALDRDAEACAAYRESAGPEGLDPDLVSPRIRAVLSRCGPLDNAGPAPQIPPHAGTQG